MTARAQSIASAPPSRVGTRDRAVYVGIALLGVVAVVFANSEITRFVAQRAPGGAVALLFVLPLLVVLTRPIGVTPGHRTRRTERALAIVYAIRERRWRILFGSIGLAVLWLMVVGGVSILLYALGLYQQTSAVANWLYVSAAAMLIWNLIPGRFHVRPASPYTIGVIAPAASAATMYAGLVALDRSDKRWQLTTGEKGDIVVEQMHAALSGGGDPPPLQTARVYFTWPRLWSRLTGDRAVPVDLIGTTATKDLLGRRFGVIALLTNDVLTDEKTLSRFLIRELRQFKRTSPAVAFVVEEITDETRLLVDGAAAQSAIEDYDLFRVDFSRDAARRALKQTNAAAPVAWLVTRPPFRIPRRNRRS